MDTTTWTVIGIIATLATFGIVYWKTTSVRKERERHAHKDIVVVLARILAQGQDSLDLPVVESLLKSKAREYRTNLSTVDELPKIAEDLVAKFTESEFITPEVRHKLIEKVMLLQEKFERKEPRLEEATAEFQQSAQAYTYRRNIVLSTMGALLAATITFVISGVILDTDLIRSDQVSMITMITIVVLLAAVGTYVFEYQQLKRKKAERSLYLNKVFEEIVIEVLHEIAPKASVERNVKIVQGDYYSEADFVVKVNDESVPIEIKTGSVRHEAISSLVAAMKLLTSRRGVLITSSQVQENIKKMALEHNVLLLEGITTKEDLIRGLRETKLFG